MFYLLLLETRRQTQIARSRWVQLLADQVFFVLGFLLVTGVFELVTNGRYTLHATLASMIGWIVWRAAAGCMADGVNSIAEDAQIGTLEQVWLSGKGITAVLLVRCVVLMLYYSLRVAVMVSLILLILRLPWQMNGKTAVFALIIYLLTLAGACGLVFVIAGLHLVYKNVEAITYALATSLMFFTGALVSFQDIPAVYPFSRLLPLTIGLDLLRSIAAANQQPVTSTFMLEFFILAFHSLVYLGFGFIVFNWAQKRVLLDGSLAHY